MGFRSMISGHRGRHGMVFPLLGLRVATVVALRLPAIQTLIDHAVAMVATASAGDEEGGHGHAVTWPP